MKVYKIPIQTMTGVTSFESRLEKTKLHYRYYPSWSTHTIVLFHGLVSSSIYLSALAHRISERKIAQVILPDWRGHGEDTRELIWNKSTDVVQDFEELMIHIRTKTAVERVSFLGHSYGAKWLLKILNDLPSSFPVDDRYFVAPYLQNQQVKLHWMKTENETYKIHWPDGVRTGKERFDYPKRFLDEFKISETQDYSKFHLIEAGQDEILDSVNGEGFKSVLKISDATHMGIVMEKSHIDLICDLIERNTTPT